MELGFTSQKAAAEQCGRIAEATYARAENGTGFPHPGTLDKIAKGFRLKSKDLLALRDGRPLEPTATVSAEDLALDAAVERLRALPVDVRQPVVRLINGLADALG